MTTSWVIVERSTGNALFETFNPKLVAAINTIRYQVVPILEYLQALNAEIKINA